MSERVEEKKVCFEKKERVRRSLEEQMLLKRKNQRQILSLSKTVNLGERKEDNKGER